MYGYVTVKIHGENISCFDLAVVVLGEECVNKFENRHFKYIIRGDY